MQAASADALAATGLPRRRYLRADGAPIVAGLVTCECHEARVRPWLAY
jgi:hypothetical protein